MTNKQDATKIAARNLTRSQFAERLQDVGVNASANPTIGDVIADRFSRRDLMKSVLGVAAITATTGSLALDAARAQGNAAASRLPLRRARGRRRAEPSSSPTGYDADILIRWGDPVLPARRRSTRRSRPRTRRSKQFGYNNDYVGYYPDRRLAPSTACWWSTTNTPTRS